MPDPYAQQFADLSLTEQVSPPVPPVEAGSTYPPHLQPVASGTVNIPAVTPPAIIPKSDYEWECELEEERERATRTQDPKIALSWAEKVYMYVSISLEELRRDQPDNVGRPSTPPFERALREDCKAIVEKFARDQNPKAVSSILKGFG
jgi:hypothetical protein